MLFSFQAKMLIKISEHLSNSTLIRMTLCLYDLLVLRFLASKSKASKLIFLRSKSSLLAVLKIRRLILRLPRRIQAQFKRVNRLIFRIFPCKLAKGRNRRSM